MKNEIKKMCQISKGRKRKKEKRRDITITCGTNALHKNGVR